ncbi:hypothetical protein RCL_jg9633.t1 [Rhizophagus clarus]|uniref:Uncharacterized protein n=1 Tax=Rhizophagus clarus TaxID=94130 RepID=A0A8H3QZW6_9GLOM|nr:hypothetical protein RCL_jg9633.t1 [Rhizophagus clarus]
MIMEDIPDTLTPSSKITDDSTKSGTKSQKSQKQKSSSGKQKNSQSSQSTSSTVNNNKSNTLVERRHSGPLDSMRQAAYYVGQTAMEIPNVDNIPDDLCKKSLLVQDYDTQNPFFKEFDFKSYKIIKYEGRYRLIAFFETYDDLKMALETRFHLDGKDYCWTRPQPIQPKKKNGKNSLAQELKKATEDRSSSVKRSSHNAKDPK